MADTKKKAPAKKPTHPKYNEMIAAAITSLKERGGSSRIAILKYITSKYKVSDNSNLVNVQLKQALKKGVVSGALLQVKGAGASGSFKLSKAAGKPKAPKKAAAKKLKPKAPKAAKKPKAKKSATKKPKAAKKSPKKAAKPKKVKKPAAKKSPKKAAKPKAKKAKKTAKK